MSCIARRSLFAAALFTATLVTATLVPCSLAQAQQSIVEAAEVNPAPITPPPAANTEVEGTAEVEHTAAPVPPPVLDSPAPLAISALPCGCQSHCCCSKANKAAAMAAMRGAYKGVFYANDYSYLNDPCYDGPSFCGDSLKGMCDGKLDVGGEFRMRYHDENGIRGLGLTGVDDNFWLTRYRMFANYRFNDTFRFYGEYLYADSAGEQFNNRPIEENRGEAQNLFLDIKLLDGDYGKLIGRFGRQELLLGDQRLVSPLDWANTRRTFDGYRGTWTKGQYTLDGFYVNPVNRDAAHEDRWDSTNDEVHFYGAYLSNKDHWLGTVDNYYLGLTNEALDFDYHTIGSRVVGTGWHGINYVYEGGFQFGSNSPTYGDHDANYATGGLGKQLHIAGHKPTLWFWYDYASGGNDFPGARGDDGFDHLFPLAHKYLGFMDLFGRRNIHDLNVQYIMPLHDKVSLLLWYHYFMLDEKTTPYSVTMAPYNNVAAAEDRELGHEIDVLFNITLNARNNVLLGYSHFSAGDYYDLTPGVQSNADADFFYFQYQSRF